MIQGLLSIIFNILSWLLDMMPRFEFITNVTESINVIADFAYEASPVIPLRTIGICLGVVITFYNRLFLMKVINWVIHRIPLIN